MGDARIPNIANSARAAHPQAVGDADVQRLSGLLKPFLQSHFSPKAIEKLVRDPRLFPFFRDLFATHRPDEILKIAVISEQGQTTIRATLTTKVTQCGVDLSRDGYAAERKCTTSTVVTSESILKLDRNYVARLNARPPTHIRHHPPPMVAKAPDVVEPPKIETPPPPPEPTVDWNSPQSVVGWYDGIYARTAKRIRPQPPREKGQPSVVITQKPSVTHAPRHLTPTEQLSQDVFRESIATDEERQQYAAQAETRGSIGIVVRPERRDAQQLNRQISRANSSAAQKAHDFFWVDATQILPGQVGSSFHRIFVNRPEKWEKLLGRDAEVLPNFEEIQSDFRADRQLVADVVMVLSQLTPVVGNALVGKVLEGTYGKINEETASRVIWVHAWLGKLVRHPDLLTDKALQDLSPMARQILMFGLSRWSHLKVYSSYHPVFRNIERHHFRAFVGRWEPDTIVHLNAFPNRYLFLTNWVAEVGRTHLDHKTIASQMNSEEYEILHAMVGGGRFDIPDEATRLASLDILELVRKSSALGTTASR